MRRLDEKFAFLLYPVVRGKSAMLPSEIAGFCGEKRRFLVFRLCLNNSDERLLVPIQAAQLSDFWLFQHHGVIPLCLGSQRFRAEQAGDGMAHQIRRQQAREAAG